MSAHASSAGPHETLDYLAGSALWGAASPLYATWAKKGEWNKIEAVFHSGKVRFLPGLPAGSGGRALLPAPLSWHFKKGAKFADMGRLSLSDDVKLVSLCASEWNFERDGQPQQVRGGWFSPDGDYQTVEREHQAKTAIDEKKFDRANDGQFFGYTAIAADKSFIARVEADADTPGWDEVVKHLRARKELRLGRSKTAEYGRASAELVDDSKWAIPAANASGPADCVFIHALTDLALVDSNGQPTLHPDPSVFGLSGWDLNPERTFIQVRSYSLWNRFRGAHDSERQVIKAGSVIAFKKSTASVASSGPGGSKQGYSLAWRENGLGLFAVNPAYLFQVPTPAATQSADAASGPAEEPREVEEPKSTDAEIIQTAHARFCRRTLQHLALALGREWAGRWQKGGLSKSQWARLREAAVNARDREHLLSELLLNDDTGLFKHGLSSKKWGDADDDGTPANSVCTSLNDRGAVALKAELRRARLPEKEDYVSTLALHACREAAIACARAKRND